MVDRTHEHYTHGHHESVLRSHSRRTVSNSAGYLIPYLKPGQTILDVGSGPGTITIDLARRVSPGRVIGLDASAEIVAQATALAAERSVTNVEFLTADAYALDFADGSFDIVHAHQILHHLADPVAVLSQMRRVRRPDGVVAAREVDYAGIFWYPHLDGLDRWISLYDAVHRSNGGEPNAGRQVKAWARQAGFAEVTSSASIWCFTSAEDRAWWGGMWADRVLQSAFAADAMGKGLATQADLQEISQAWLAWAADEDAWLAMPHGEVLCRG